MPSRASICVIVLFISLQSLLSLSTPCHRIALHFEGYFCSDEKTETSYQLIKDNRVFTLKVLDNDPRGKTTILNLERLKKQPYVASLVEYRTVGREIWFVMDYNRQVHLKNMIRVSEDDRQQLSNFFGFFRKVFEGLSNLHRSGFVHAKLTPYSIQLDADENPIISNLDMLVPVDSAHVPRVSLNYISPEALKSAVGGEAIRFRPSMNYYSFGVILYEYLKKRPPVQLIYPSYTSQLLSPVQFGSMDNEDAFELLFKLLKPASKRAKYMEIKHLLEIYERRASSKLLKKNFEYRMRDYIGPGEESVLGKHLRRKYSVFCYCFLGVSGVFMLLSVGVTFKRQFLLVLGGGEKSGLSV